MRWKATRRPGAPWGVLAALLCGCSAVQAEERVIGAPCEGCENVFVGMPETLQSRARIAPAGEPGEPMLLQGTVTWPDGEPAADIIVYAYHTNENGIYPDAETFHGRLRGWARTEENGSYRFDTIRPGAYPGRTAPQHVHMHIIEPDRFTYWIMDVMFADDPLLHESDRRRAETGRGGSGLVHPERDAEGTWRVRRDIVLGRHVPGWSCPRRWTFPLPFHQSVSWSPDGTRLAYSAVMSSWDEGYSIFVAGADGSDAQRIETGGDSDLYPVWSPDGSRLAFASKRDGNSDIYVMQADGSQVERLTTHEANDNHPSWSPDGARLAFHSNRDGNVDIYVLGIADGTLQRITEHPAADYNPAWSPDGTRIAFDSDRDDVEGDEIHVIAPDGSGLRRVVDAGVFPSWSPDGERILFASDGLFVVEVDGSGRRQLLDHAVCGDWSPDGSTIVAAAIEYDETCRDRHVLVTVPVAGGPPQHLRIGQR